MNTTRDEKILKKFGKHLEKIRTEKGLSLRKLADLADVDFSQIHRIEKGQSNPSLTMLMTIAEALESTAQELLDFK
jgi:transcriptional regulator with XRE-family HTH domain